MNAQWMSDYPQTTLFLSPWISVFHSSINGSDAQYLISKAYVAIVEVGEKTTATQKPDRLINSYALNKQTKIDS